MGVSMIDIFVISAYFLFVLWIGYYTTQNIKSFDDYSVASRNMPTTLLFATMAATLVGGGATIGRVAYVYDTGIVIGVGLSAVMLNQLFSGLVIAPRIREMENVYTIGDVFGFYYGKMGRSLSSILAFVYCIAIFGVQVLAMGRILQSVTGLPLIPLAIISSLITVLYTWGGGILAVIYTDAIQFIILCFGVTTAAVVGVNKVGGMDVIIDKVSAIDISHLTLMANLSHVELLGLFIAFMFGEFLAPFYVQRYVITKSVKETRNGITFFSLFYPFNTYVILTIGLVGLVLLPAIDKDLVLTSLVRDYLPVGVVGFIFGGLIAAVMSTGDSILNTAAVIFTRDLYEEFINPNADSKKLLKITRMATVVVGIAGIAIAILFPSVIDLMIQTYELWAPSVIPPILVAMLWGESKKRNISPYSGSLGIIIGLFTTIIWLFILKEPFGVPGVLVGIVANLVTLFLSHVATKNIKPTGLYIQENLH